MGVTIDFYVACACNYLAPFALRRCLGWVFSSCRRKPHDSSPDHASASPDTVNADDPDLAAQVQTQAIREQLIRRINAYTHPVA